MKNIYSKIKTLNSQFPTHNSEGGFAFVAIIIVVILIFSIMLVSGAEEFTLSKEQTGGDDSQPTATPQPTATQSANVNFESQISTESGFEELQENTEIIEED